jgi:hypothetical protein
MLDEADQNEQDQLAWRDYHNTVQNSLQWELDQDPVDFDRVCTLEGEIADAQEAMSSLVEEANNLSNTMIWFNSLHECFQFIDPTTEQPPEVDPATNDHWNWS